jgi:hypothetical protein
MPAGQVTMPGQSISSSHVTTHTPDASQAPSVEGHASWHAANGLPPAPVLEEVVDVAPPAPVVVEPVVVRPDPVVPPALPPLPPEEPPPEPAMSPAVSSGGMHDAIESAHPTAAVIHAKPWPTFRMAPHPARAA